MLLHLMSRANLDVNWKFRPIVGRLFSLYGYTYHQLNGVGSAMSPSSNQLSCFAILPFDEAESLCGLSARAKVE
jgi:hypothetical protein